MKFGPGWTWLKILPLWIAIMSGVLSLVRETYGMFAVNPIDSKSVFWSCARIALILSAGIAWWQEHQKVLRLEKEAKTPSLTLAERASLDIVAQMLRGASDAEVGVLICILNHEKIEAPQLQNAAKDRDAILHALEKWKHELIAEDIEHGTNRTFYSIVPGYREALKRFLASRD
jgi:hypothetical protein